MAVLYFVSLAFGFSLLTCDAASIGSSTCRHDAGNRFVHPVLGRNTQMSKTTDFKILRNPEFWDLFYHEIKERKSWKCDFPKDILFRNFEADSNLYKDDYIFKTRRLGTDKWLQSDDTWTTTLIGACEEIASGKKGMYSESLRRYHILEALEDYVYHIHYFNEVATILDARHEKVVVMSQQTSPIHDIDKLDPVMLVSYSERFEDNKTTSLWDRCVERHTHSNPHHQAHCLWQECCRCGESKTPAVTCPNCDSLREMALREMVCDKVSRRLQKDLNGVISDEMWNVDINFFKGIPQEWLEKASLLMHQMEHWSKTNNEDIIITK